MPTEKSESKPETTEDPATDEEHPQDALRREGLRLNPQWQTEHLDTTGGGPVDFSRTPAFEEARQHAVRQGALAADADYTPDNVVFSDDSDEAERQREAVRKQAEELPEDEAERRPPGYADGMGGPYNQGVVAAEDDDQASANETSTPVAAPATKATAEGSDGKDSDKTEAKPTSSSSRSSGSTTTKAAAKPSTSTSSTAKK
jgi:hypothetical protein